MSSRESWSLPITITPRRIKRLRRAALILPRRARRASETPGPPRVLVWQEVIEHFLDSDGIVRWARRVARGARTRCARSVP